MNLQLTALNRILIIGGLFVVFAMIGFFFVYQPKTNQINLTRAEIAALQQQYDELKRVADQKPLYLTLIDQIKQRLKGVEITADPRTYVPSYLKQVEDLAKRDGLIVTSVSPQATAVPSPGASTAPTPVAVHPPNIPGPIGNVAGQVAQGVSGPGLPQANKAAGGTPQPRATPIAGAAGLPPGVEPGSPRAAALVYLNQSFTQVPFAMEFNGKYESFERFLRDLNKFPKLLGVSDVSLSPNGKAEVGVAPQLKITMPVTAYRLSPTGPGPQAVPSPAPGGK